MATAFTPFDLGKPTDENLRNLDFVRGKFNEAVQAVNLRDTEIQRLNLVNGDLQRRAVDAQQALEARTSELDALRKELATQAGRVQELGDKLAALQKEPPKIGVQDLVGQFKGNIDRINADVISQKTPGMLIDSVEVEVRGGIDVKDGLHITQLPASALGVASVSVLKFNLKPSSVLRIVDDDGGLR
jgi:FtsZ-binding cell division protein ZapB